MIRRIPPAFAGMSAFYVESDTGVLVTNARGEAATDRDVAYVDRMEQPEIDRITLEMCAYHRGRGERLEPWQIEAESYALARMRHEQFIAFCQSILAAGQKLEPEYRERYGRALLRQESV